MITELLPDRQWRGTFIEFFDTTSTADVQAGRKTRVYEVYGQGSVRLGEIKWFGRWRKYAFFPAPDTVYETVCLGEIVEFITARMQARKKVEP